MLQQIIRSLCISKTGEKACKNNNGYTLVELITVIAIISIMMGGVSYGVNLVFSKDAVKCATHLNDAVFEARSVAMTKPGDYLLKVSQASGVYYAQIIEKTESGESLYQDMPLDDKKTIAKIEFAFDQDSAFTGDVKDSPIYISFDKSKGNITGIGTNINVTKIKDSVAPGESGYTDGVITFTVTQKKGNKPPQDVTIITATGKHFVGDR